MITLSILSVLGGGVLGMRLKVLVLVPAIGLALSAIAGLGAARGDDLWSVVLAMIVAATCLQMGYLGGSATRVVIAALRAPRRRRIETPVTATQSGHRQVISA